MVLSAHLGLRSGAAVAADDRGVALVHGMRRALLGDVGSAARALLDELAAGGLDEERLLADPLGAGALAGRLERAGWLTRTLLDADGPRATLEPLGFDGVLAARRPAPGARVRLSRFAVMRPDRDGSVVVESGAALARVRLHRPGLAGEVGALAEPAAACDDALVGLLIAAGLVVADDGAEEATLATAGWSPVDLLFHARSRMGRTDAPYGGTYALRERFGAPPAVRAPLEGAIALPRPDLGALAAADPPLGEVMEARRSIREHDDERPIALGQLGELLFRCARVQEHLRFEDEEATLRPYPAGGALHELELHLAVRRCAGLEPGLYRYEPEAHALSPLAQEGPALDGLLEHARLAAAMARRPQVLLVVAARFGRVQVKYESVAYALVLKHVGALYQTVYLAATAMGLAPCGLGGGDADLFARAAGTDYLEETSVGEMALGSRAQAS